MSTSAYVHIPFCRGKCFYCSFISYNKLELVDKYFNALYEQVSTQYKGEKLKTLYIGGGTPSLINTEKYKHLFEILQFDNNPEITIEVNPNDLSLNYLNSLINLGFNRISIGVQTFDDIILKNIGRRHTSLEAKQAIELAKQAVFKNISLDFIYGLPNQTQEGFLSDLKQAISSNIQHISLYGLKIEKDCFFEANPPQNLPDIDTQADMYTKAVELLISNGFEHYEVSNFSKKSFSSKHNLTYWNAHNYYAFGCAASGYIDDLRYTNETTLEKYIKNPLKTIAQSPLSTQEKLEETIFLGLRKMDGIDISLINNEFGIDFEKKYSTVLEKYKDYFIKTPKGYALNLRGTLISTVILAEFIE